MSNLRRSMMMAGRGGGVPTIAKGVETITGENTYIEVTHNFGTLNYIIVCRNTNIRANAVGIMGCWLVSGVGAYNVTIQGANRTAFVFESEARNGSIVNNVVTGFAGQIVTYATTTTARIYCRNTSYPFIMGDRYEWVAVAVDSLPNSNTLDASSATIEYSHTLGTDNFIGACYAASPQFGVNGSLAAFVAPKFFENLSGILAIGLETRSTWSGYSSPLVSLSTGTSSSVTFAGRASSYPFQAGVYNSTLIDIT